MKIKFYGEATKHPLEEETTHLHLREKKISSNNFYAIASSSSFCFSLLYVLMNKILFTNLFTLYWCFLQ